MPSLASLKHLTFSSSLDYGPVLECSTFLAFLKEKHIQGIDGWKEVKKSNVHLKLKRDIIILNGLEYISLTAIINFAYHHRDILQICKDITSDIEHHLLKCNLIPTEGGVCKKVESIKDIYILVSQVNFTKVPVLKDSSVQVVDSVYEVYRDDFTDEQWSRIVFFEYHFNKQHPRSISRSTTEQIKLKYDFLKQCTETKNLAETLSKQHQNITKERQQRKAESNILNGIYLKGCSRHLPNIIDSEITTFVAGIPFHSNDFAFVVNCSGFCKHQHGLHVFVFVDKESTRCDLGDLGTAILASVTQSHNDRFVDVVFVSVDCTVQYENENGILSRFHFFDDVCQGKLSQAILYICRSADHLDSLEEFEEKCPRCFAPYSLQPLYWKTFDVEREWFLDVPLLMQIILETFLNAESVSRSVHTEDFVRGKLTRLYALYDSLLQVLNRKHIGVVQELNTNELIYNYHNVTTVFSITSQAGVTKSLKSAEKELKQNADTDLLYWDSYIREHPIEYDTDAGTVLRCICLRDCHLVLGLDNLVRLTFRRDPDRGQTKSNQICTLPITLKGVPMDSTAAISWHCEAMCDGKDVCACKMQKTLGLEDFKTTILKDTVEEQTTRNKFSLFMTWDLTKLWNSVFQQKDFITVSAFKDQNEDLSMSFDALSLAAHEPAISVPNANEVETDDYYDEDAIDEQQDYDDVLEEDSTSSDDNESADGVIDNISDISTIDISEDECYPLPLSDEESQTCLDDATDDEFSRYDEVEEEELERSAIHNFVPLATFDVKADSDQNNVTTTDVPFQIFDPPVYIEKHPPPAIGRDDDINKLREVLDDVSIKSGKRYASNPNQERILLAPGHKIGNNLLKLIKENQQYRLFLPEFPLLHLRKSKIINLCSAYKSAGLIQLLMYMHDEDNTDWLKLISINNIEIATRNIRRLAMTFHVVVMMLFMDTLVEQELIKLKSQLIEHSKLNKDLEEQYESFIERRKENATFALHLDIMQHCDEVVGIHMAERIGGEEGYQLLLSCVKSSLPFSFLNGASSYAAFCMQLLNEHYSAGSFWQSMKMCLFTSKHKNSTINIGLDTQREMDHRDALRGFRPRAGLSAIIPRISLVDMFDDVHSARSTVFDKTHLQEEEFEKDQADIFKISKKDILHIIPTAKMMIERLKSSDTNECGEAPYNIYSSNLDLLTQCILDKNTFCLGTILMYKYAVREKMFGLTTKDVPPLPDHAPKELLQKVKNTKGTTVQRGTCKPKHILLSKDVLEKKRQKHVQKMRKTYDCMSSEMNTCQALLKPDCSKAKVPKSLGIKTAVLSLAEECLSLQRNSGDPGNETQTVVTMEEIYSDSSFSHECAFSIKLIFIEFAGVKFKVPERGVSYMDFVAKHIFGKLKHQFPRADHMIVCEEKYKYTPDDLKSATRSNRTTDAKSSISHLKSASDILVSDIFNKKAVTSTMEGKQMISKYLASNISKLKLTNLMLDIDSELHIRDCQCGSPKACNCPSYAMPVRAQFGPNGFEKQENLHNIRQNKGEAEMSQLDWMIETSDISDGEAVLSVVTSGDIDALVIHLFTISRLWPRKEDGTFINEVYLLLQKPSKKFDFYCVTKLISVLESKYGRGCCMTIAVLLCIGGNDFLPKFSGRSHTAVLKAGLSTGRIPDLYSILDHGDEVKGTVNIEEYLHLIKVLYCPKTYNVDQLSLEEIRQLSIKSPLKTEFNSPDKWMPPRSALLKMTLLVNCQIDYLLTAGHSAAPLPQFMSYGCLKRGEGGQIEYDLGNEVKTSTGNNVLTKPENQLQMRLAAARVARKRRSLDTPQKGQRQKRRPPASTPRKLPMRKN